ncbi:class I SAM-dependent methyltransferase [Oceanirhabdus sp. W0125-5]|uniref:class I SAM-dependent methyltransferase n=1 Tax=Oceanirhabdus sp. W0125-5 TaxID=2999116 RepID=UPI0022F3462C|nr:class I SAM-dependent methyltransferase [Oceanirhabdus sp. W0125-5]WBW96942.1 class I SAM-dependent methyltransferase [Oceanirhabdus sp. W0125-5]
MNNHEKVKHWEEYEGVEVLKSIGVKEGASIIDFGCGFGHYAISASQAIGAKGKVYAVDIDKRILKFAEERISNRGISNIITVHSKERNTLDFEDDTMDIILLYDIMHGTSIDRFEFLKEVHRVLKEDGILSILPFHLSNFRDAEGKKKKYSIKKLVQEICDLGFQLSSKIEDRGIHFEKYHSPHYIKKGGIDFEDLERGTIVNFIKL